MFSCDKSKKTWYTACDTSISARHLITSDSSHVREAIKCHALSIAVEIRGPTPYKSWTLGMANDARATSTPHVSFALFCELNERDRSLVDINIRAV